MSESFLEEQRQAYLESGNQQSAFSLLNTGRDAFLVRAALIETASARIDAQYYIWNNDATGRYLAGRLLAAADRGVQVRLLLDDINVVGNEALFVAIDQHPNIDVRIYNPVSARSGLRRTLSQIGNFDRINRRMHNKSFVVDGAVGIAGGRNIGDEYFDEDPEKNTRDRDAMVLGPLAGDMAHGFQAYWAHSWAYPVERLSKNSEAEVSETLSRLNEEASGAATLQASPPRERKAAQALLERWFANSIQAPGELVFDPPPEDFQVPATTPQPSARALFQLAGEAESNILIESGYLVLNDEQLGQAQGLGNPRVSITAFTNSLATTDVLANHAGYARWRKSMLKQGMDLYELRPDAPACEHWITAGKACQQRGMSLHSKAVVFDRETLFIGSLNVNLRSIYLNGETVLIIHSPQLAQAVANDIHYAIEQENSWRVTLDDSGDLAWQAGGQRLSREPEVGLWRRIKAQLLSWLPIAKYL